MQRYTTSVQPSFIEKYFVYFLYLPFQVTRTDHSCVEIHSHGSVQTGRQPVQLRTQCIRNWIGTINLRHISNGLTENPLPYTGVRFLDNVSKRYDP